MIAKKLVPAPEAVPAIGVVGTGGPDEAQEAEGAEDGNAVSKELFTSQRGAPDGADALVVVLLELKFAEDVAVVRFVGTSDGTREGQLVVQADRTALSLQMDVSVLTTTCAVEPERLVYSMAWLACALSQDISPRSKPYLCASNDGRIWPRDIYLSRSK